MKKLPEICAEQFIFAQIGALFTDRSAYEMSKAMPRKLDVIVRVTRLGSF